MIKYSLVMKMFIKLNNTKNTRSLSDLINKDGLSIKKHYLIRSDALNKLSEKDKDILKNTFHLKRVIDLRCETETKNSPDVKIEGVKLYLNPILPANRVGVTKKGNDEDDFKDFIEAIYASGVSSSMDFMTKVYREIVTEDFSNAAYERFLKILLEDIGGATLWHCSAGKDRAGFATILVLYLLDFKMEDIIEDYLSTNLFYQNSIQEFIKLYGQEYSNVLEVVFGVCREYIDALFNEINLHYGNLDNYIYQGLHFTKEDQRKLKEIYLEER